MIKFEINDAPRDSIPLEMDGNYKIIDIKKLLQQTYKDYADLNPDEYLLLIEGFSFTLNLPSYHLKFP